MSVGSQEVSNERGAVEVSLTWYSRLLRLRFRGGVLNRDLKLIFASRLAGSFGDGLYAYLLPYYMSKTLKATSEEIGLLYAVINLVAAITLPVGGILADRYDRKKILIVGWIAWFPAPIIFSFAQNWFQMLPGMVLWGFWLGGATSIAYITRSADNNRLTLTFTALSAAWSIGYIFSPALGGYLAGTWNMQFVFYSSSILYAVAAVILLFISSQHVKPTPPDSKEDRYSFSDFLKTRKLIALSMFFALIMFTLMMFRPFIPNFLGDVYDYGDFEIGILGSISFFGSAVLGVSLGRLGDRYRKTYAIAASMIVCCSSLVLLVVSGDFLLLSVAFFLAGGSYLTWSLMGAIVGPLAPERIRARWISIPQSLVMLASFIAPYIGGLLYDMSPYYLMFVAIIATLLLAFLAYAKRVED